VATTLVGGKFCVRPSGKITVCSIPILQISSSGLVRGACSPEANANASTRAFADAQSAHCISVLGNSALASVRSSSAKSFGPSHLRARAVDCPGASLAGCQL